MKYPDNLPFDLMEHCQYKVDEWDEVFYSIQKYMILLLKANPNVLGLLWLPDNCYVKVTKLGKILIDNRDIFISKKVYYSYTGYAYGQLKRMTQFHTSGYMGEKRKQLVEKYGYDTKNAAHLIRLLNMSIETLTTGQVNVLRHDNNRLLDIKDGKWTLKQVKDEADRLFKLAQEVFISSKLPTYPNKDKAQEILIKIQREFYKDSACNHDNILVK